MTDVPGLPTADPCRVGPEGLSPWREKHETIKEKREKKSVDCQHQHFVEDLPAFPDSHCSVHS
jgi:hypothetical protein